MALAAALVIIAHTFFASIPRHPRARRTAGQRERTSVVTELLENYRKNLL